MLKLQLHETKTELESESAKLNEKVSELLQKE